MPCLICLAEDRTLTPTNKLRNLIRHANLPELTKLKGSLCWECVAIIRKITRFLELVRKVQDFQCARVVTKVQKQSSLGQTKVKTLEDSIHVLYEEPIKIEYTSDDNDTYFVSAVDDSEVEIQEEKPFIEYEQIECTEESITKQGVTVKIGVEIDDPLASEDKSYICNLCNFVSPNEEILIKHISSNCEVITVDNSEYLKIPNNEDATRKIKRKHIASKYVDDTSELLEIRPKRGRPVKKQRGRPKNIKKEPAFVDIQTSEISQDEFCCNNPGSNESDSNRASKKRGRNKRKPLSREERLAKKRIQERRRKERLKMNPETREEMLRKERERYALKKALGLIVPRHQLPPYIAEDIRERQRQQYHKTRKKIL